MHKYTLFRDTYIHTYISRYRQEFSISQGPINTNQEGLSEDKVRTSPQEVLRYNVLVIYFLLLSIFFCAYAFLGDLFGNIKYRFFNTVVFNFLK
jgi:hypothetical protein